MKNGVAEGVASDSHDTIPGHVRTGLWIFGHKSVVHKLCWQDFWVFWPPMLTISMVWTLIKSGHFWTTCLVPTSFCKSSLWTFFKEVALTHPAWNSLVEKLYFIIPSNCFYEILLVEVMNNKQQHGSYFNFIKLDCRR